MDDKKDRLDTSGFRFGLIGAGAFGPRLARQIRQVAELAAVCEPQREKREAFTAEFGPEVPAYADPEELLARGDIDAVAITSPNWTHKPLTIAAAQAGKHVFCEKAMANSVPDCWDMVAACEKAAVRLMIGHKRTLRPPWRRMIDLREDLGPVLSVTAVLYFMRPTDWPGWWTETDKSGGTLFLAGIHVIDWMRAMCGEVRSVRALAAPRQDSYYQFPDTIHTQLEFESGAIGSLDVSLVYQPLEYRDSGGPLVVCRHGSIRFRPYTTHIDLYWQHTGEPHPHLERFQDLGHDYAFRKELRDFARWVLYGTEPCLTWREGLRCVEVLEAAQRSASEGGAVITLPLYPALER